MLIIVALKNTVIVFLEFKTETTNERNKHDNSGQKAENNPISTRILLNGFGSLSDCEINTVVFIVTMLIGRVDPELIEFVDIDVIYNKRTRLAISRVLFVHAVIRFA